MHFIERYPQGKKPLIINLVEDRETPPDYDEHAMNFSLVTPAYEDIAAGR
ncbi:hypothetical protein [Buttiauxella sp.]